MNKTNKNVSMRKSVVLTALLVAFTAFAGCLSDDEISCGDGTKLVDGDCVAILSNSNNSETVSFTLVGKEMSFIGQGGDIDGIVNPDISVPLGFKVSIKLVMGENNLHDVTIDEFNVATDQIGRASCRERV